MTKASWRSCWAVAAAAFVFALPAQADPIIDFEELQPNIYFVDGFVSQGFEFTFDGFGIGVVDSVAGFSEFASPPTNASGQFVTMLNTQGIVMESEANDPFTIATFDFSFISPLPGVGAPGVIVGQLIITALGQNGDILVQLVDFPGADIGGNFAFETIAMSELAAGFSQPLQQIYFYSCVYDSAGACVSVDSPAQFALDNIVIASPVPEPGTLLLVALGIGLIGVARRRTVR